jgi:hypothetical protein
VVLEVASQNAAVDRAEAAEQVGRRVGLRWKKTSCRPLEENPPAEMADERAPALAGAGNEIQEEESTR